MNLIRRPAEAPLTVTNAASAIATSGPKTAKISPYSHAYALAGNRDQQKIRPSAAWGDVDSLGF